MLILENDEDDILHLRGLSAEDTATLCAAYGSGDIEAVLQQGWPPGYG
ncbi:hypothetical protein [Kitasatospora phosalacinea]|uniref:Uncharacterized protein n=1 Tax=Kitasatospora phosalacinea TaxID=2065 RepID=A0ABW6GGL3_9ACTN